MTVIDHELRAMLKDHEFGAGNFMVRLAASHHADRARLVLDGALVMDDGVIEPELTVADIVGHADAIADWYAAQGVKPRDPVALVFDDNALYLLHFVALTSLGAISVHINDGLDRAVMAEYIRRVGATRVITEDGFCEGIADALAAAEMSIPVARVQAVPVSRAPGAPGREVYRHRPDDPVLIAHTSGTTGVPKAVEHTHHNFVYGIRKQLERMGGHRVLQAMPHSHAASMTMLIAMFLRGSQIKLQSNKAPDDVLAAIEAFEPDFFCSFPGVYMALCRRDLQQYDLGSIGCWLSTGDANHEPHIRRLMACGRHRRNGEWRPGSYFIDNLGMTEFGFSVLRRVYRPGQGEVSFDRCVGRPFEWIDVAVLDEGGAPLPPGKVGRLGVRSECLTPGYWNDPLRSEQNHLGGYWLTGDLVYRSDNGDFFHLDRIPDAIVTEQGTLFSCRAEELVMKHVPEIFDCSIVGLPSSGGQVRIVMTVDLCDEASDAGLLGRINALLAAHEMVTVDELIVGQQHLDTGVTGKKRKFAMRQRLEAVGSNRFSVGGA